MPVESSGSGVKVPQAGPQVPCEGGAGRMSGAVVGESGR